MRHSMFDSEHIWGDVEPRFHSCNHQLVAEVGNKVTEESHGISYTCIVVIHHSWAAVGVSWCITHHLQWPSAAFTDEF